MENTKKDEWLYKGFGIKVDNRYLCISKKGINIIGQILNLNPSDNIAIKSEDGLYILPYKEISELRPMPMRTKEGSIKTTLQLKKDRDYIKVDEFKVKDIVDIIEDYSTSVYGKL